MERLPCGWARTGWKHCRRPSKKASWGSEAVVVHIIAALYLLVSDLCLVCLNWIERTTTSTYTKCMRAGRVTSIIFAFWSLFSKNLKNRPIARCHKPRRYCRTATGGAYKQCRVKSTPCWITYHYWLFIQIWLFILFKNLYNLFCLLYAFYCMYFKIYLSFLHGSNNFINYTNGQNF